MSLENSQSYVVLWAVSRNILGRVPQSRTVYEKRSKATRVQTSWWPVAERRWRLCATSETGTQSAPRYRGAVPMRQRRIKIMTQARHVSRECHAPAASSRRQTSSYQSERGLLHSAHVAVRLDRLTVKSNSCVAEKN